MSSNTPCNTAQLNLQTKQILLHVRILYSKDNFNYMLQSGLLGLLLMLEVVMYNTTDPTECTVSYTCSGKQVKSEFTGARPASPAAAFVPIARLDRYALSYYYWKQLYKSN